MIEKTLFNSFLMGGYECADHINRSGDRVDLLAVTAHDIRVDEDYALLATTGIRTVREGICWSRVETAPGVYDFHEVRNRMYAARQAGIQQIWDMCHFGFPADLSPTHPRFAQRFGMLCDAFAKFYRAETDEVMIVTPVNEISFLSWHAGDMRGTVPFAVHSGWDIKYHLCKAAIQGIKALKAVDPSCRILLIEPLIHIHPRSGEMTSEDILRMNEDQYQAMDIIGGRICPELGGEESYLDILGLNYYYNNQWEHCGDQLHWPGRTKHQRPLSELLYAVHQRYGRPIVLAETGHFGCGRAEWFDHVAEECARTTEMGVDLQGICLYPVISRPDWDDLNWYHDSGIWDITPTDKTRFANEPYLQAIRNYTSAHKITTTTPEYQFAI